MNVLLDARMSEWSGIGRYTTGLATALARRDDIALTLVVASGAPQVIAEHTTTAHPVVSVPASASPFSLRGARELGAAVAHVRPDLTHCPHFPLPWPIRHPLVVSLQDLTPLLVSGVMPSAFKRGVYRAMNRRAARHADSIIVPSAHTGRDIAAAFPEARGKLQTILDAADDFSAGPVGEVPAGLLQPGERYIFSMGNTKPHKGLPTLFSAFVGLAAGDRSLRLLLAGNGDPAYLDAHVPAAVRDRVSFTGRVNDDELRALYAGAALFAFPSRYEGFGLPPLEAMSFGTPVVTTDAASLPEVVDDAALVVPAGNAVALEKALCGVLGNPERAAALAVAGRSRAAQLTWDHTAAETVDVYRSLLG